MIKINGYKLYGVTKFTKDIKTNNYFDYEVIRISGRDKLVPLGWDPKSTAEKGDLSSVEKGDLVFPPKNPIDAIINYGYEELTKELMK